MNGWFPKTLVTLLILLGVGMAGLSLIRLTRMPHNGLEAAAERGIFSERARR